MCKLASLRHRRLLAVAAGTVAALAPAAALAAQPIASGNYSGKGTNCYNNTASGHYTDCAPAKTSMTFAVSSNGADVINFKGYYTYYCGGGTAYVDDSKVKVSSTGSFHASGQYPSYGPNHKRNGTYHAFIKGQFIDGGHKADVTYQAADYFSGVPPHTPPCGTRVKGVATTH